MNTPTFISNKQALMEERRCLISMPDDTKFFCKVTIVNLMLNGASASSPSPFLRRDSQNSEPLDEIRRRFHPKIRKTARSMICLKKLGELSSDTGAAVVFQDEVHFTVKATITRQWFPKVRLYSERKSIGYSGFVAPDTGELFMAKPDWFNYETTIESIQEFIASFCQKRTNEYIW